MTGRTHLRLAALAVIVGTLTLAPSNAHGQSTTNVEVRMTDFAFVPPEIEVPLGGTVTWIYDDAQCDLLPVCPGHDTVAEVDGPDGEPLWQSETMKGDGASFTATMTQLGEIPYICTLHQSALADMDAVVNVVAAAGAPDTGGAPPPSESIPTLPTTGGPAAGLAAGLAALLLALALRASTR